MRFNIRRAEYYYITVKDRPGQAYEMLSRLKGMGINLIAFNAVPFGPESTQLTLFPDDSAKLEKLARQVGLHMDGPHYAIMVQGEDEPGALAAIHEKLYKANLNVFSATAVTDGKGDFGYIIYVQHDAFEQAAEVLSI
jgi:prephenate dehydratase